MSPTSHPPRDYQIAELTQGIQLPLPALQRRHLKVITEFLAEAWNGLLESQEQTLRTKDEPEINALMEARLNNVREEKNEWLMIITGVTRGKESISYDGSSLEKRPDLSVHISGRPFHFPLIVECKLIDKGTRKGVDLYCDKGLARFIDGEYAWYAQEAFMLAYVRDGATIAPCLTPHLAENQKKPLDPFLTEQLPQAGSLSALELAQSRHGRRFPDNPGPINVWHLWLS